ncbi:MAG: glutamine--fructose-6-phosphate transaminase (isomerizing) [Bacillota bacterium]
MCGIVGYVGRKSADTFLLNGLKKLEYRGYDSAGIAVTNGKNIHSEKSKGSLSELEKILDNQKGLFSHTGIGHTRWATHGQPSDLNSHPHSDCADELSIVHNGIIENYKELKSMLIERGHKFSSETDSEVIVHLLEELYEDDMIEALAKLDQKLEGSYAIAVITKKEREAIYALKKDSPLIAGKGENENYLASDIPALLADTDEFYIFEDGDIARVDPYKIEFFDLNNNKVQRDSFSANWGADMVDKKGYDHFMLKEIHEQADVARRIMKDRFRADDIDLPELDDLLVFNYNKILITACGTAYHSGLIGRFLLEEFAGLPVQVEVASELRYKRNFLDEKTLVIVVSQSGETADTLAALRLAKKSGSKVLALTNVVGSSVARESDANLYLSAGPEISVASTKAYSAMLIAFYLLALKLAVKQGMIFQEDFKILSKSLKEIPIKLEKSIEKFKQTAQKIAGSIKNYKSVFFIGRNIDYALALEGALKLKEISYIHAEAHPAGELKHGSLALIEDGVPVFAITTRKEMAVKTLANIEEVLARGGNVNLITSSDVKYKEAGAAEYFVIPDVSEPWRSVLAAIPLQLIAYYTALELDKNIDKPRNLAKSVTVE